MRRVVLAIAPVNSPRIGAGATVLGEDQALLTLRHLVNDPVYQLK